MTEPLQDFAESQYERPNQTWSCGNAELAAGCPRGPDAHGVCVTRALCQPVLQRGQWKCNRSQLQGGKCEPGPNKDGRCGCPVEPCSPRRALRSHRGRFVFGCFAALLAVLAIVLSSSSRNEFLAPGPLTEPHALILKEAQRCANCHDAGHHGLGGWLLATACGPSTTAIPQWQLCLECHKDMIRSDNALVAHTVSRGQLDSLTQQAVQRITTQVGHEAKMFPLTETREGLACASCHQEHHGALHDLTAISDQQCNICHQAQFASLAHGHPEFDNWPYRRRSRIIFDHVSHGQRHFQEKQQEFRCTSCHALDATNEPELMGGYEQNCAGCHDADLQRSMDQPLALLRLPLIDRELLRTEGLSVGQWPDALTGDFDGPVPPLMSMMLWADPLAKASLEQFEPGFDFFSIDPDNFDDLEAVSDLVWAIKRLIYELQRDGEAAIVRRAERLCKLRGVALGPAQLEALAAGFDRSAAGTVARAFTRLQAEIKLPKRTAGAGVKSSSGGGAATLSGVWRSSADASELTVQVRGHANPLLRAWLELAAYLGPDALRHTAELTKTTGVGQCTMCHSLEYASRQMNAVTINWTARADAMAATSSFADTDRVAHRSFTKFRHAPHLLQAQVSDCTACHRPDASAPYAQSYQALDPQVGCSGFAAISKAACADCHVPEGAGDGCLKCHNYHVGGIE